MEQRKIMLEQGQKTGARCAWELNIINLSLRQNAWMDLQLFRTKVTSRYGAEYQYSSRTVQDTSQVGPQET